MTENHEHHDHHNHHDHHEHHRHPHEDHPHGDGKSNLSFEQKLVKRLEHWIAHNADHAANYREWAGQTTEKGLPAVGSLLEKAARATEDISHVLRKAIDEIPQA